MSRTPILTAMLWTAAVGCGSDEAPIVDAPPADAPAVDASTGVDAAPAAIGLDVTSLTMQAECGGATTPATLVVTNVATTPVVITGLTFTGGFSTEAPVPTTIAVGGSINVVVTPPAAVIGTDRGGATVTGTLTFATDVGGPAPVVQLTSTIVGANLALVDAASQPITTLALDSATAACPAPATVFIHNSGNAEATLFTSGASNFALGGFAPSSSVPAGGTVSTGLAVVTFGACTGSETVTYQATGQVCTTTPLALAASFNITGSSSCFCS